MTNHIFNCGIFIKLSPNQTLQSLKIIIWYKKLLFGIIMYISFAIKKYDLV